MNDVWITKKNIRLTSRILFSKAPGCKRASKSAIACLCYISFKCSHPQHLPRPLHRPPFYSLPRLILECWVIHFLNAEFKHFLLTHSHHVIYTRRALTSFVLVGRERERECRRNKNIDIHGRSDDNCHTLKGGKYKNWLGRLCISEVLEKRALVLHVQNYKDDFCLAMAIIYT